MIALGGLDLLPDLLDRTIATRLSAGATVLGMAAFAGGALYLVISVLFGVASEAVLRSRLADSDKPERRPVEQREDDEDNYSDEPWSTANTQRAYMGSYDGRNAYGLYTDDV